MEHGRKNDIYRKDSFIRAWRVASQELETHMHALVSWRAQTGGILEWRNASTIRHTVHRHGIREEASSSSSLQQVSAPRHIRDKNERISWRQCSWDKSKLSLSISLIHQESSHSSCIFVSIGLMSLRLDTDPGYTWTEQDYFAADKTPD